ncbi:MAG: polyprenyl synthetase family protein [Chitinophagaceae bacterium]
MKEIQFFLKKELKIFEKTFEEAVRSRVSLLDRIMKYVVKTKGKQLRPMYVLLSAKIHGELTEQTYRTASFVELLHTATLVHDDVVDDADKRRGFFSINALWKNKVAVLVGDYLLSKGLLLSLSNKDFYILEILSKAVKDMSEGELLQAEKARKLDINESIYFEIIEFKTASLISSACAAGAYSVTQNIETANLMAQYGKMIGIAFQIRDDLFDYGKVDIGKPTGNDIKEKKMTLPLIYTLNHCDKQIKRKIISIFKKNKKTKEDLAYIIQQVNLNGGIQYAENKMNEFVKKAEEIIEPYPNSEAKTHLLNLTKFSIQRNY